MSNASTHAARLSPIPPPRNPRRFIQVIRAPKGGAEERGMCLNQDVTAQLMHWDDVTEGKVRCTGLPDCRFCLYLPEARWYAYMPVFRETTGRVACFELTLEAARLCPQMNDKRVPLRGKQIFIWRVGKGKFGQGRARIEDRRVLHLPPAEDMDVLLDLVCARDELAFQPQLHARRKEGGVA